MPRLIWVEGPSGSGKTTVSKYLESELGFDRYKVDKLVMDLTENRDPKLRFDHVFKHVYMDDEESWERFWYERGSASYKPRSAEEVLDEYRDALLNIEGYMLPDEDRFHLAYAFWNTILSNRDISLMQGNDVVLDALTAPQTRINCLKTDYLPQDIERYVLRLRVEMETAVQRALERENPQTDEYRKKIIERTEEIWRKVVEEHPLNQGELTRLAIKSMVLDNNSREDLERIKDYLKGLDNLDKE